MIKIISKRLVLLLSVVMYNTLVISAKEWLPDVLGNGFEMHYCNQGKDYDGTVRSTVIRHLSDDSDGRGVLYIHGFNDYFFQKEMAEEFATHGYDFYAVDLRKYGRSIENRSSMFDVRNLKEYFPDIDSALVIMQKAGVHEIVLFGHSTGGLIASYYMALHPNQKIISALVLNSPFLDWNLGKLERFVPAVDFLGKLFPSMPIPQGSGTSYSESLLKGEKGEWTYNTDWKLKKSPDVTAGWVRAISTAQDYLHNHPYCIKVPVLLMYSSKSINVEKWVPEANHADVVLDVDDIKKYGLRLGHDVTPLKVNGGIHDLVLSSESVRYPLYRYIFSWLSKNVKTESMSPKE